MPKRYILNVLGKVAHLRHGLTEACNTDQIVRRMNSDSVPISYRLCEHCLEGQTVVFRARRVTQ